MPLAYTDVDLVTTTKEGAAMVVTQVATGKMKKATTAGAGNGEGSFLTDTGLQVRNQRGRLAVYLENTDAVYDCYVRFKTDYAAEGLDLADRDVVVPAGQSLIVGPFSALYENDNKEDSTGDGATFTNYILMQFSTDNDAHATTGYLGSGNDFPLLVAPIYIPAKVSE